MTTAVQTTAAPAGTTRALFINSGILGHRAVAGLLRDVVDLIPTVRAAHMDLSRDLTLRDRVIRKALSLRLAPASGVFANFDLRRWREELNVGLLAARRIEAAEEIAGQFDALHFHTQATAYASIGRMRRTPSIVSIDATQHLASLEVGRLARVTYAPNVRHDRLVFRAAAAIVSTSEWAGRDLAAIYPECAGKIHVLPYPVRLSADDSWIDERARRAATGAPVRVLFIGGDLPRKGGFELLDAWAGGGFADRAVLDLVTDWPLAVDRLPPGVRVVRGIAPYTTPWIDLWRRADLFVMPTRHEAFGMVYQEAAAAALPAIGTRINAIPEIVENGRTGLLVEPRDQDGLVRAIRSLVDCGDLRRTMGTAARDRMSRIGALAKYATDLESLIETITNRHVVARH